MSLGYIGYCKKKTESDNAVIYVYGGADWNNPNYIPNSENNYDGEFSISKDILNWERTKAKKQTEYIHWTYTAIEKGIAAVTVPCENAFFNGGNNIDFIARMCMKQVFERVYSGGNFPDKAGFIQ